jgi:hypothetical protein
MDLSYFREGPSFNKRNLLLAVTDVPSKFSYLTPIADVLRGSVALKTDGNGQLIGDHSRTDNITVDSRLITPTNAKATCSSLLSVAKQLYGIKLNAAIVDDTAYGLFISSVLLSGQLSYLVDLDISFIPMNYDNLYNLCKFVNPIVSGYNPMKRLSMVKCGLKANGTYRIIESLIGNNFIEELFLSGNLATDYAVDVLVRLLFHSESRLKSLGFGDNLITAAAIDKLAPVVARHKFLSNIQLHDSDLVTQELALK